MQGDAGRSPCLVMGHSLWTISICKQTHQQVLRTEQAKKKN